MHNEMMLDSVAICLFLFTIALQNADYISPRNRLNPEQKIQRLTDTLPRSFILDYDLRPNGRQTPLMTISLKFGSATGLSFR